jgi:hypothetical protein
LREGELKVPPEYEGLVLPLVDFLQVFDYAIERFACAMSIEHGKSLRQTAGQAPKQFVKAAGRATLIQL